MPKDQAETKGHDQDRGSEKGRADWLHQIILVAYSPCAAYTGEYLRIQQIMSEEIVDLEEAVARRGSLRSYAGPWEGQIVLACRKCQKKLKHTGKKDGMAKLSKELKKRGRRNGVVLSVIGVSCLNMCPKGGVTVCTQGQLGRGECSIVRTKADVDALVGHL